MSKTLRVGMVGYGFMGKAHSNAWRQAPYCFPLKAKLEMHTLCGRNAAGVQAARAQLGWQYAATDWREVVESPLIDIVDINTPNDSHAEIAIAAARAGKHVLCEKPLALNVKEAEAMLAAAQKAHVVHMICHNYRRVPALAQAKRMIAEGAVGEVYHYYARYAQDWLVDPEVPLRWKLQKPISGSGANGDINVHLIDLGRYLVGEFKEVCGLMNTFIKERPLMDGNGAEQDLPPKPARKKDKGKAAKKSAAAAGQDPADRPVQPRGKVTVDDAALFIGRFASGALANLEATRYAPGRKNHMAIEVNGSKGSLCFDLEDMNRLKFCDTASLPDRQGFRDILVLQPGGALPHIGQWWRAGHLPGYEHAFIHTVADFVNACVERKPVHPTFEDGLKNQRVLAAVEESVKTHGWVKV
jgi:predicted dehydrogenase